MPVYTFQLAAHLAGRAVSVVAAGGADVVTSGVLDGDAKFVATLPVGDYIATSGTGYYKHSSAGTVDLGDRDGLLTEAIANSTFARTSRALALGPRWVFLGDSITQAGASKDTRPDGALDNYNLYGGFTTFATLLSGGRIRHVYNAGVNGDRAEWMLARFDTDVTPKQPDVVHVLAGTNNYVSWDLKTYTDTMKSIIAKVRAIGATPVMGTIPPCNTDGAPRKQVITLINAWVRQYAATQGIPVVDYYAVLADPVTGDYKSGYTADGLHPEGPGKIAMGQALVAAVDKMLPTSFYPVVADSVDPNNLLQNGTFSIAAASPAPPTVSATAAAASSSLAAGTYYYAATVDSWVGTTLLSNVVSVTAATGDSVTVTVPQVTGQHKVSIYRGTSAGNLTLLDWVNPANPTVYVDNGSKTPTVGLPPATANFGAMTGWGTATGNDWTERVSVSGIPGSVLRIRPRNSSAGLLSSTINAGTSTFQPGDILAFSCYLAQQSGAGATPTLDFNATYGDRAINTLGTGDVAGRIYREFPVPDGATTLTVRLTTASSAVGSYVDYGQVGLYNLTRLGLVGL